MSDDSTTTNTSAIKPGANEIALRIDKDAAQALYGHVNSELPLHDTAEGVEGAKKYLSHRLGQALSTEADIDPPALSAKHEEEVVMLLSPAAARALQLSFQEGTSLDYSLRIDLARRVQDALALSGTAAKPVSIVPPAMEEAASYPAKPSYG